MDSVDDLINMYSAAESNIAVAGARTWRAFTLMEADEVEADIPQGFHEIPEWGDHGCRRVWCSKAHRAIITFVEGDIFIVRYSTVEDYFIGWYRNDMFYSDTARRVVS